MTQQKSFSELSDYHKVKAVMNRSQPKSGTLQRRLTGYGTNASRRGSTSQLLQKSDAFTRKDKKTLDHKRAINPAISGAAAGASAASLGANIGGVTLRRVGQKKTFEDAINDYQWKNKTGATAKQLKAAKLGSKLQAKALPLTFAAGGLGAIASVNGVQMSHLWNKKDKVYDNVEKSYDPEYNYRSSKLKRSRRENVGANALGIASAGVAGGAAYDAAASGYHAVKGNKTTALKALKSSGKWGLGAAALGAGSYALKRDSKNQYQKAGSRKVFRPISWSEEVPIGTVRKGVITTPLKLALRKATEKEFQRRALLNPVSPAVARNEKFMRGLAIGTNLSFVGANILASGLASRTGEEELMRGVKKSAFIRD